MKSVFKIKWKLTTSANKIKTMKVKFIPLYIIATSVSLLSCKKFLEVDSPKNQVAAETAFQDEKIANATVIGMYTNMNGFNSQFGSGLLSTLLSIAADDYLYAAGSYDAFKDNALLSSTSFLDRLWSQPYAHIGQANKVIEGVEASSLSSQVKAQLMGEAKFVRAFCYFYLVNTFNKVPLVKDTDVFKNNLLPQSTKQEVYDFIINDLTDAVANLSDAYQGGTERVRPNKKAAQALLARVYLYTQKWELAESTASLVIADTRYKIPSDLNSVFLRTSEEAIWQLQTVNTSTPGVNTWEGFSIVPTSTSVNPLYRVYQTTLDAFAATDKRKASWTTQQIFNNVIYRYPSKYKYRTATPVLEYNTVLRLAEQYLIRAEARANIGTPAKITDAINDLNILRGRADVTLLNTNLSKPDALLAVENERRFELLGEWGHRWFDLVRTNRAVAVLSVSKGNGFTASDMLIPIHDEIIKTNPNLKPND